MKSKIISAFISIAFSLGLSAQISVDIQVPPAGIILRESLWNLSLVNNSNRDEEIVLNMEVKNAGTGQPALTASSGRLVLSPGIKVLNPAAVQPVVYNFYDAAFAQEYLPFGNYIVCFKIDYLGGNAENGRSGVECANIVIDPLSPPMLSFPQNKDTVLNPFPQFSWIPPGPASMLSDVTYHFIVVQVSPGQEPVEAIRNNIPVYSADGLVAPNSYYPSSYPQLDTGALYAWQVWALNKNGYNGTSEVWTFHTASHPDQRQMVSQSYIHLGANRGIYNLADKMIHVRYYSYDPAQETTLEFIDGNGEVIRSEKAAIVPGNNYYDIELGNSFKEGKLYKLNLKLRSGREYFLLFRISKKQH